MSCRAYRDKQRHVQKNDCVLLSLIVSGVEYMNISAPDGLPVDTADNLSMILIPPDFRLDFAFNSKRENYAALFRLDELKWDSVSRKIELQMRNQEVELGPVVSVPLNRLNRLKEQFEDVCSLSKSGIPADNGIAELLLTGILAEYAEFFRKNSGQDIPLPVRQLKNAIDSDVGFRHSVKEIMADFPFSEFHLRNLFQKYYLQNH